VFDPSFEYEQEYRIRVGDEIRIEFLSDIEPSTNASRVVVRPDGRISLRGVDVVLAAGLTPAELDAALTDGFSKILVDPSLSVIIDRFAGEMIYVVGQVKNPREVPGGTDDVAAGGRSRRRVQRRANITAGRRASSGADVSPRSRSTRNGSWRSRSSRSRLPCARRMW
jgi:protein involved in polysaccharide export with SLBB domain